METFLCGLSAAFKAFFLCPRSKAASCCCGRFGDPPEMSLASRIKEIMNLKNQQCKEKAVVQTFGINATGF
jgi:hypothetical protein